MYTIHIILHHRSIIINVGPYTIAYPGIIICVCVWGGGGGNGERGRGLLRD